jgi:uncharacterized protein (DUF433 family)
MEGETYFMTQKPHIVDKGRGPQLSGHRLTVLDIFTYLRRGHDWDFILRALPSLTRDEFDAVLGYVHSHRAELEALDDKAEARIQQDIAEQEKQGLRPPLRLDLPLEERVALLRQKLAAVRSAAS